MSKAENILNKLISKIAKEQNFVNYALKIEPVSSGGANYTSTLHNITITEGDKVVHMFAKVAAVGEAMRLQAPKFYQTESFFYTKLLNLYEQLQEEHQVPQEYRLVFPKFYGCNTEIYEETIVLENLVMDGYRAYDRFKSIDWEYAKSAITELAKLHALAFAYDEYYPEEYKHLIDNLKFVFDTESKMMAEYMDKVAVKAVDNTYEENREKMERFVKIFESSRFFGFYKWVRRPVLGHGDYRPSNLMHRIRKVS